MNEIHQMSYMVTFFTREKELNQSMMILDMMAEIVTASKHLPILPKVIIILSDSVVLISHKLKER